MLDRPILLFLHIPKTAGTTLKTMISNNYNSSEILDAYEHTEWENGFQKLDNKEEIKLIQGHFRFGYHKFIEPFSAKYFTFLRNPVDLTISHYSHLVRSTNPEHKKRIKGINSLKEFAGIHSSYNIQTRILSGVYNIDEFKKNEAEHFQRAVDNLTNNISCIGIQERFIESVIAISHMFKWKRNMFISTNIGSNSKKDIEASTREAINNNNLLDWKIYNIALAKFEEQIGSIPNFERKRKYYTQKKRLFDKFGPLFQKLKK